MASGPSIRGVWARAKRTFARHWRALLVFSLAIFIPLGLIETIDHELAEVELERLSETAAWAVAGVSFLVVMTALLGEIFFSGITAAAVSETHGGSVPTLRELARSIPYVTLIVIDILFAVGLAFAFVLLLVPAFFFLGYFGLAAPLAKIEHLGVRAAFRRSFRLARGHLGLVVLVLGPVAIAGQFLSSGVAQGAEEVLGESFVAEWLGASLGELVSTPAWALAAVALTYELLATEGSAAAS